MCDNKDFGKFEWFVRLLPGMRVCLYLCDIACLRIGSVSYGSLSKVFFLRYVFNWFFILLGFLIMRGISASICIIVSAFVSFVLINRWVRWRDDVYGDGIRKAYKDEFRKCFCADYDISLMIGKMGLGSSYRVFGWFF